MLSHTADKTKKRARAGSRGWGGMVCGVTSGGQRQAVLLRWAVPTRAHIGCPAVSGSLGCSPDTLHPGHTPKLAAVPTAPWGWCVHRHCAWVEGRSEEIQPRVPPTHPSWGAGNHSPNPYRAPVRPRGAVQAQ